MSDPILDYTASSFFDQKQWKFVEGFSASEFLGTKRIFERVNRRGRRTSIEWQQFVISHYLSSYCSISARTFVRVNQTFVSPCLFEVFYLEITGLLIR